MDLIDRQAAIDTLHMDTSIIPYKKAREYADATILEIRNRLEKLPSVQPEPIWGLPVSADRPLADVEIVSRLRDIQKQIPGGSYAIDRAIEIIEAVASAQPEIIVCADCKHWMCHDRRCGYWNHGVKPLMWCSQAERRTDESEK